METGSFWRIMTGRVKKIGIITNMERDLGLVRTRQALDWLLANGCAVFVGAEVGRALGAPALAADFETNRSQADFIVVLGGDGTILGEARSSALYGTPILGVNIGTLGYLTDVEATGLICALEKALAGEFVLERRMMLEAETGDDKAGGPGLALNDVCVVRAAYAPMLSMQLRINGEFIDDYRADGFIVATPTGSTAYNLSAGGPILKPESEMIAVTPICPHMLYAKPLVVAADDEVSIEIAGGANVRGDMILDGQSRLSVAPGDIVNIRRSALYVRIMKTEYKSFFDILRRKMLRQ
jgi:NAD+ kinase